MGNHYHDTMFSQEVKKQQSELGSRDHYSNYEIAAEPSNVVLTQPEADFIAARDSLYMASVSETGWPYVQHRGGPPGFLRVLNAKTIGFADFRGNRQYISLGNFIKDDRVSLILTDYPNKRRLKIIGHAISVPVDDEQLGYALAVPNYQAKIERFFKITIEAFEWNCPQHIRQRYTLEDFASATAKLQQRIAALEVALEQNGIPLPDTTG